MSGNPVGNKMDKVTLGLLCGTLQHGLRMGDASWNQKFVKNTNLPVVKGKSSKKKKIKL